MKLSIVIEAQEDFELILPLLRKIDRYQKNGKYLFYRLVCVCKEHEESDLKVCLKKHKINVPYSFWEKNVDGEVVQRDSVPHFFAEDLFRNPADMVLFLRNSETTYICVEKAKELNLLVGLIEQEGIAYPVHIPADFIFSTQTVQWWKEIVYKIVHHFQL